MAKKTKKTLWSQPYKAYRYRWEFARRNKDYQSDYDRLNKLESKKLYKRHIKSMYTKWNFLPIDYKKSYDDLLDIASGININTKFFNTAQEESGLFIAGDSRYETVAFVDGYSKDSITDSNLRFKAGDDLADPEEIKKVKSLRIVFNMEYSKEQLLYEAEIHIDRIKQFQTGVTRTQYKQYKQYLKVYDWFNKHKEYDWEELAKKFYSGDFKRDKEYAKRKVKRDYERCKKLIEGGYRQIR